MGISLINIDDRIPDFDFCVDWRFIFKEMPYISILVAMKEQSISYLKVSLMCVAY